MKLKDLLSKLTQMYLMTTIYLDCKGFKKFVLFDGFAYDLYENLTIHAQKLKHETLLLHGEVKTIEFKNGILIIYLTDPFKENK